MIDYEKIGALVVLVLVLKELRGLRLELAETCRLMLQIVQGAGIGNTSASPRTDPSDAAGASGGSVGPVVKQATPREAAVSAG